MKTRILTALLTLALLLALPACGQKPAPAETATPLPAEEPVDTAPANDAGTNTAAEPGALLDSGTNVNENYYAVYNTDYSGGATDPTDSSFTMSTMAGSYPGPEITVHYDKDTVTVKLLHIWYYEDRFELYAGSQDDLQKLGDANYSLEVIVEDPEADELWAKEIRFVRFEDLG